jgi:hypothetical protein
LELNEQNAAIKLRAHHLLCMQGFQGYGYSETFVANMTRVVELIRGETGAVVELVEGADDLCCCCPHRQGVACQSRPGSDEDIRAMDRRVLEKLKLSLPVRQKADDLLTHVNTVLKTHTDVQDICGCCSWRSACLWYASRGCETA